MNTQLFGAYRLAQTAIDWLAGALFLVFLHRSVRDRLLLNLNGPGLLLVAAIVLTSCAVFGFRQPLRNSVALALGAFSVSVWATLMLVHASAGITLDRAPLYFVAAAAVLTVAQAYAGIDRILPWFWALVATVTTVGLARGWIESFSYGDGGQLAALVETGKSFPRWLVGSTLLATTFALVWRQPTLAACLPATLHGGLGFLAVVSTVTMGIASLVLVRLARRPVAMSVALLMPVWALFARGYVEYYPLTAWLLLLTAGVSLTKLDSRAAGAGLALLSLTYIGFWPLAILMVAARAAATKSARDLLSVLVWGIAAAIVIVTVCWPTGLADFAQALHVTMNYGDTETSFPRYLGRASSPGSVFFTLSYASSREHLRDLAYMFLHGIGPMTLPLLVLVLACIVARRGGAGSSGASPIALPGSALVTYLILYMFFIPKRGPTGDLDLFYPSYLLVGYVTGAALDDQRVPGWLRTISISVLIGQMAALSLELTDIKVVQRL